MTNWTESYDSNTNLNLRWIYPQPGAVAFGRGSSSGLPINPPSSAGPSVGDGWTEASRRSRLRLGGLLAWSTGGRLS